MGCEAVPCGADGVEGVGGGERGQGGHEEPGGWGVAVALDEGAGFGGLEGAVGGGEELDFHCEATGGVEGGGVHARAGAERGRPFEATVGALQCSRERRVEVGGQGTARGRGR